MRPRTRRIPQVAVYGAVAGGGGFTPSSSQSLAFLNRVATVTGTGNPTYGLSTTERNAYDTMITGMVSDGVWSILDALYMLATVSRGVALLNLVSGSFLGVEHTIGAGQFTADQGYTGVTGGYIDTQLDPRLTSGQNWNGGGSAGFFGWTLTNFGLGTDYQSMGAAGNGNLESRIYPHYNNNLPYVRIDDGAFVNPTGGPGHFYGVTTDHTTQTGYVDKTGTSAAANPVIPLGPSMVLLADNNSGATPFLGTSCAYALGGLFNSTHQGNLYDRIHAYLQAVAGVP
jgi:hypothetical protein